MDIFTHPQSLRRKRRGIQPEEIKEYYVDQRAFIGAGDFR